MSDHFDGDGVADLVTTKIKEEVVVQDELSGERRVVTSRYERVEEPSDTFDATDASTMLDQTPEGIRSRVREVSRSWTPATTEPRSRPGFDDEWTYR